MHNWDRPFVANPRFLLLLGVSAAGPLLYFFVSPGTFLTDIPEIGLMLGIVGGFFVVASLIRFHEDRDLLEKQMCEFGWIGAIVGGLIGAGLATYSLAEGYSIISIFEETTIVLQIGIVAGSLAGIVFSTAEAGSAQRGGERDHLLAESTWTNQPEPNPIVVEIVERIAELDGKEPLEMEPLSAHISVDVFEKLRAKGDSTWQVVFHTDKYEIRVNSYGTVTVYDNKQAVERRLTTSVEQDING
jgi:hypothetical protein